jgi:D-alanyl-lipoteichoic acid acyltransferase DltB (MBOAT superfamily)
MPFNSYYYIIFFLPTVIAVYLILNQITNATVTKSWLVLASLYFYGFINIYYIPLILFSIIANFIFAIQLDRNIKGKLARRFILLSGISFNLGLLFYFKYSRFLIATINELFTIYMPTLHIMLPLAISFFTFQQIAYLVDKYRGEIKSNNILDYCLFVMFFPKLIAGPIVYYNELIPQFEGIRKRILTYKNLSYGITLVSIGLFKKVAIADLFAGYVAKGFDIAESLSFYEAWVTSLSYTLQIYFDFSGYTDIALGSAYFFNIKLPINFDSPYKSLNMQEFWRRWHITLSRWLMKYLYIPLGGSRGSKIRTYLNILTTFIICGMWHGAGWTYLAWGGMHGLGIIVFRIWRSTGLKLPKVVSWAITFLYVNFAWVFFRANNFKDAIKVFRGMLNYETIELSSFPRDYFSTLSNSELFLETFSTLFTGNEGSIVYVLIGIMVCVAFNNSLEIIKKLNLWWAVGTALIAVFSLMLLSKENPFIYFEF